MPLPKPKKEERIREFISRCMADKTANKEFPKTSQRAAVCRAQFDKKDK